MGCWVQSHIVGSERLARLDQTERLELCERALDLGGKALILRHLEQPRESRTEHRACLRCGNDAAQELARGDIEEMRIATKRVVDHVIASPVTHAGALSARGSPTHWHALAMTLLLSRLYHLAFRSYVRSPALSKTTGQ